MSQLDYERVNAVLEPIYSDIEADLPFMFSADRPVWAQPICRLWAQTALVILQKELGDTDVTFEHIVCDPTDLAQRKHGLEPVYHHYIKATDETPMPHVIDGTYQQFVRRLSGIALPRILITPAHEAPNKLAPAFIHPSIFFVWRPDLYPTDVFRQPEDRAA